MMVIQVECVTMVKSNSALPRFLELWEYLQARMQDLANDVAAKTFSEINGIFDLVVEAGRYTSFQLGIKYLSEAGKIYPLGDKERLWLERHFGMELSYSETDQYAEGGGYIYYDMTFPCDERFKEIYPTWPTGRCWTGGEWD